MCGGVASSLPAAAVRMEEPGEPIDLQKARQQHEAYTEVMGTVGSAMQVLRGLVKEVHQILSGGRGCCI